MNDITQALQKAGMKLPSQNQRIWQWLKDNGPHSVKDLAVELKIGEPTVQAAVTNLMQRKMLERHSRVDHKGVRLNNHYSARGRTFELLPLPASKGQKEAVSQPVVGVVHDVPAFSPEQLLTNCTLGEMRQVYDYLRRFFK